MIAKYKIFLFFTALMIVLVIPLRSSANMLDVSEDKEIRMGKEAAEQVINFYGVVDNPAELARLHGIVDHIIEVSERSNIEYHFYIVNTKVVNAFALPGGYIFVTRGLMDFVDDDDELAAVVSHEIVHVAHRHGVSLYKKSLKNMMLNFLLLVLTRDPNVVVASQMVQQSKVDIFGRGAEIEADTYGIRYMKKAGYNPLAMLKFFKKLERQSTHYPNLLADYFDFHPPMDKRQKIVRNEYKKLGIETPPEIPENVITERVIVHETCGDDGKCTAQLTGRKKPIMTLADSGAESSEYARAKNISSVLNSLFEEGVRMYEFKKRRAGGVWSLWVRNIKIVEVLPADIEASERKTPEELLDQWTDNLKKFLWNDFVEDDI